MPRKRSFIQKFQQFECKRDNSPNLFTTDLYYSIPASGESLHSGSNEMECKEPIVIASHDQRDEEHTYEAKHYNSSEEINLLSPKEMMFLDELSPLFQELIQKPLAFTGGFVSGVLKLDPKSDPVMDWLSKTTGIDIPNPMKNTNDDDSNSGPQTIDIE